MRLLLVFLTYSIFSTVLFAQKHLEANDFQRNERFVELGMPFTSYNSNQLLSKSEEININIIPSHVFSCFGVGWEASDNSLDPALFKVSYRTLEPSGMWSELIEMEGEISPDETPTKKYWT